VLKPITGKSLKSEAEKELEKSFEESKDVFRK
jgi:hypothetical protein